VRIGTPLTAIVLAGVIGLWLWSIAPSRVEREVRRLVRDCVTDLNSAPPRGDAARLAQCFTTDVVVDFGRRTTPIRGRDTLLSIVNRLQHRIAAFRIKIDDLHVEIIDTVLVRVTFTVSIVARRSEFREELFDARAFAAEFRKSADGWRMSRLAALETLR
jgi:hypothetical protein